MSEDRKKLDQYIKATDQRVESWSDAQKAAFREATHALRPSSTQKRVCEPQNGVRPPKQEV